MSWTAFWKKVKLVLIGLLVVTFIMILTVSYAIFIIGRQGSL